MERILDTSFSTVIGFIALLLLTRLLGKKQLSQITYFTYITGIAMGNIASEMVNREVRVIDGITALAVWTLLTYVLEYISLKSATIRVLLDDQPTIVIKKGAIQRKAMASLRLNMDDLSMLLRNNDVFSIEEVDYAIFEPNGQLSVLKKPAMETASKKDLQIPVSERRYMPAELIVDGKLVSKNLKEQNLSREWLAKQLEKRRCPVDRGSVFCRIAK